MSESRSFCPRCGESIPSEDTISQSVAGSGDAVRLCRECYFDDFSLITAPDRLTIKICTSCGAINTDDTWNDVNTVDYTEVAIGLISEKLQVHRAAIDVEWRVDPSQADPNTIVMHCFVQATVDGRRVDAETSVPISLVRQTCPRCGRIAGDYYGSTVQIRAVDRDLLQIERETVRTMLSDIVDSMQETGDRNAFVTEFSSTEHGLDIKLSTPKIGRKLTRRIVNRFGGTLDSSETLVTQDEDGNEVYRVTFAVHLPPYVQGDIIKPTDSDEPVLVTGAKGRVTGRGLLTNDRYTSSLDEGERPAAQRIGSTDDAEWTTVVTVEDEHSVQIIDPETHQSVTITRPPFFDADATKVPVIKNDTAVYILPEDSLPNH